VLVVTNKYLASASVRKTVVKMGVKIDTLRCTGCGACVYICPVGVLEVEDMKCRVSEGCITCGLCVDRCQWHAITLIKEPIKKKKKTK
jgi:NAD-dependent dihydropyrimidine dehydrogenase PreA subunit